MFVLKENFPINANALKELLNSDLMQFIFESLFKTHKILKKIWNACPYLRNLSTIVLMKNFI